MAGRTCTDGADFSDEDTISYWIFPHVKETNFDVESLEEFRAKCFAFLNERAGSYLWHEDAVNLSPVGPNAAGKQKHVTCTSHATCMLNKESVSRDEFLIRIFDSSEIA